MPLLPLEPFVFPDDLLEPQAAVEEAAAPWWVLHTRPRAEKSLARRLLRATTPFFLPLCKRQWRHRGRLLCSYVPLFPGYVFLRADSQAVFKTLETNMVARVLPVPDQSQLHGDLARVYCLIATEEKCLPRGSRSW